jgi:restriction endonuclease S subunit
MGSNYIELRTKQIENLPVKIPSNKEEDAIAEEITKTVKEILKLKKNNPDSDTKKLEDEVDNLVFRLYGLDPDERRIIERQ